MKKVTRYTANPFGDEVPDILSLKSSGKRALAVITWRIKTFEMGIDMLPMDSIMVEEFNTFHEKTVPLPTFKKGLKELEAASVIAKAARRGQYYINRYNLKPLSDYSAKWQSLQSQ